MKAQKPDIRLKHITPFEGLSNSFVRDICEDHVGFIWVATANGLNRYDGYNFNTYKNNPEIKHSIVANDINDLLIDSQNKFWIATIDGLELYDRETDKFIHYPETENYSINKILEDSKKDIWLGAKDAIFKYDKKNNKFIKLPLYTNNLNISFLLEDHNKNFWIGTSEGVYLLDPADNTLKKQGQFNLITITSIIEDSKKTLWFASRDMGIVKYNPVSEKIDHYQHQPGNENSLATNKILCLYEDSLSRIWIGSENGGLTIFDQKANIFYNYKNSEADPESLVFNTIYSIFCDRNKNIWLGTYGGVDLVKRNKFVHIRRNVLDPNSLSNNNIICFLEDKKGNIWIGTDGGGLNKWDRMSGKFRHYKHDPKNSKSLSGDAVTALEEDDEGRIWVATWGGGLNMFSPETGEFIHFKHSAQNANTILTNDLFGLYKDKNSKLWISTVIGLDCLDLETKVFTHYNFDNTALKDLVGGMLEDKHGNFWIGAFRGLQILDRQTNKLETFLHNANDLHTISNDLIFSIFQDSKDNLWICTGGGLNLYNRKNKTFKSYRQKEGLPTDGINGILEDGNGMLWISTSNGLSMFNPATQKFKNYSVADGLQNNEFKIKAYYKLKSGEMLFGGSNGFNIFHPRDITENKSIPKVAFTSFKIFNEEMGVETPNSPLKKQISMTREIEISYKESVISFDFVALNYVSPEKNQFAYILEGFDDKWNYVGNKRSATYTSLDPGRYIFRVKASNNDGIWNEKGTSLIIVVTPPFWATWWFRSLMILLFAGSIVGIYAVRINSITKQKLVLEELVKHRTSELENQAELLKEVNVEITEQGRHIEKLYIELKDSIRAAQAIQKSILPSSNLIKRYLPKSFILNKPKDMVGGDFYWFNVVKNKIIFAAVDCTGHGVSGAFMSITSHHLLNHCITNKDFSASQILNKLNEEVVKELNASNEDERTLDGMDIALCVLDKERNILEYSGAANTLYIIRNKKVIQIKGDKFPIGLSIDDKLHTFTNHEIPLQPGDKIYMFSDGYPDQLGGKDGIEKFKYPNFRELLIKISDQEMDKQRMLLEETFTNWKRNVEQLDDILVIGFQV